MSNLSRVKIIENILLEGRCSSKKEVIKIAKKLQSGISDEKWLDSINYILYEIRKGHSGRWKNYQILNNLHIQYKEGANVDIDDIKYVDDDADKIEIIKRLIEYKKNYEPWLMPSYKKYAQYSLEELYNHIIRISKRNNISGTIQKKLIEGLNVQNIQQKIKFETEEKLKQEKSKQKKLKHKKSKKQIKK